MNAIKIATLGELDTLVPLIIKFREIKPEHQGPTLTGFLAYIALSLPQAHFGLWRLDDGGVATGYIIAEIEMRYFEKECIVVHAYNEKNDHVFFKKVLDDIKCWAKSQGCANMTCITPRSAAIERSYGFEPCGTFMKLSLKGE